MRTSDKGVIALMAHEGIVPGPYFDDVGVLTYGVGHTAAAGEPFPKHMAAGMPDDLDAELIRVFSVFRKDLEKYEAEVRRAIKVEVSQHEFDAAVSFHFNTGGIGRASWVKSLNDGDRARAGAFIMNWTKPESIIPRRQAEQNLFRNGVYPETPITVWGVTKDKRVVWKPQRRLHPDVALSLWRGAAAPDAPNTHDEPPAQGIWALLVSALMYIGGRR